jgi:formate dehydrogenase iron-sulfur subunit
MTAIDVQFTARPDGMDTYQGQQPRIGFFTDTSVCIGCKACEVACKEWNHVPEDGLALTGMSYDNSAVLGADTWRHVAFIEQQRRYATGLRQGLPDRLDPVRAAR